MQDPSQVVDPRLLPHLHLIVLPNLAKQQGIEDHVAVDCLQRAPQMIKEHPVSWQYLGPQESGTTFLEWMHPNQGQYSSDGFAWLGPEQTYEKDISDQYVLDVMYQPVGVLPEQRPPVAFKRMRYRMRPKRSGHGPFDPSFWLINYTYADAQKQHEVLQGYQIPPRQINILHTRRSLEIQGLPQRKDFMLVDRSSWPQVLFPPMARSVPQYPARGQMPMGQASPYPLPAPSAHSQGPPPPKRHRQTGPTQMPGGMPLPPMTLIHDHELELLEDTSGGDYLDHISPALISRDRFKRHHLWLEEVFSSLYSINQILPEDLGFGLVGELGELTKGILNPPTKKTLNEQERANPAALQDPQLHSSAVYKQLDPDQFAEFEQRVAEFVETRNREMDAMREKHAKMVARLNKGRFYVEAEERLREAGLDSAKIDEIVNEVQLKMSVPIQDRLDVVCVQKGALEDEEKHIDGTSDSKDQVNGQSSANEDATAGLLDELMNSETDTPAGAEKEAAVGEDAPHADAMDLIEDMDLDIPPVDAAENTTTAANAIAPSTTTDSWTGSAEEAKQSSIPPTTQTISSAEAPKSTLPTTTTTTIATDPLGGDVSSISNVLQPESMFDSEEFSAFDNMTGDDLVGEFGAGDEADLLDFDDAFGGGTGAPAEPQT